jgi:formamidopyrimidine-DNA glycosylase
MPELPEVETVRRGLAHVVGKRIFHLDLRREGLRFDFPTDLESIVGKSVLGIDRLGKFLLFRLEDDLTLLVHLGMTGRFGHEEEKHSHVIIHFFDGSTLVYTDPRRFGIIDLIRGDEGHASLSRLGSDPLKAEWTTEGLAESLKGRRTAIKVALMDQRTVAGIGNIYASEILHLAGVSPRRKAANVSKRQSEAIHSATIEVLTAAIEAGGSTLSDGQFRGVSGELGYFPHEFAVYDREGEPCFNPLCEQMVKRIIQGGRSTFFCSNCQM